MLGYCWVSVVDGAPTLAQHWVSVSCWMCTAVLYMVSVEISGLVFSTIDLDSGSVIGGDVHLHQSQT